MLAVPATLQVCFEAWVIEVGVMLAAGTLPDADLNLGANGAVAVVDRMLSIVWLGMQGATSIAVGKHVGAGRPDAAKRTIRVAIVLGWMCAGVGCLALLWGRHLVAAALTDSEDVQDKAANVLVV